MIKILWLINSEHTAGLITTYLSSLSLSLIIEVTGSRRSDLDPHWLINRPIFDHAETYEVQMKNTVDRVASDKDGGPESLVTAHWLSI